MRNTIENMSQNQAKKNQLENKRVVKQNLK